MVLQYSNVFDQNYKIPVIELDDVVRKTSCRVKGDLTIIAVICNHCPYVIHIKQVMQQLLNSAKDRGFEVIAINGNDAENYPADSPENMVKFAKDFKFPYLHDESQSTLRSLGAECTPEFYIFKEQRLYYHGRFDNSGMIEPATGADLKSAIFDVEQGIVPNNQQVSMGCSIKWR